MKLGKGKKTSGRTRGKETFVSTSEIFPVPRFRQASRGRRNRGIDSVGDVLVHFHRGFFRRVRGNDGGWSGTGDGKILLLLVVVGFQDGIVDAKDVLHESVARVPPRDATRTAPTFSVPVGRRCVINFPRGLALEIHRRRAVLLLEIIHFSGVVTWGEERFARETWSTTFTFWGK